MHEANVTARLYKSNPVKEVLPGIMADIRNLLGINDKSSPQKQNIPEETTKEARKAQGELSHDSATSAQDKPNRDWSEDMEDHDAFDESKFAGRLAATSGSEDSEHSEDEGRPPLSNTGKYDPSADLALSPTSSAESSDSEPHRKIKGTKAEQNPSSTTFLPSLMMGGYWSGSESEPEDDPELDGAQPRKNRMGQQARRKLWEKKFGTNANHVKKQQKAQNKSRDSGWDLRKGATSSNDARGWHSKSKGLPNGKREGRPERAKESKGPSQPRGKAHEQKSLHPSWEAAKKAKEQKSQSGFQGKKVVFD